MLIISLYFIFYYPRLNIYADTLYYFLKELFAFYFMFCNLNAQFPFFIFLTYAISIEIIAAPFAKLTLTIMEKKIMRMSVFLPVIHFN